MSVGTLPKTNMDPYHDGLEEKLFLFIWVMASGSVFAGHVATRFFNNGQTCCAAKRIYVQAAVL